MVVHDVIVRDERILVIRHDLGTAETDVWGKCRDGKVYRPNVLRHVDADTIRVVFDPEPLVVEVWDERHSRMFEWTRGGPGTHYKYPT